MNTILPMPATLIEVPYHLGRRGDGMGLGPEVLFRAGLPDALRRQGVDVRQRAVAPGGAAAHEVGGILAVNAAVAAEVAAVRAAGSLPIAFAGDCATCAGMLAGIRERVGVVWFDAHGDFNTPDTTTSGYFNGMALSLAVGRSWRAWTARVEGFTPVDEPDVVLAGGRDFDVEERALLDASPMQVVPIQRFNEIGPFERAIDALAERVRHVYLHIDLDVLDPSELRANAMAVAPGATVARLVQAIAYVRSRLTLAAVMFSSYDPREDTATAGPAVVEQIVLATVRPAEPEPRTPEPPEA
jgi:arginase